MNKMWIIDKDSGFLTHQGIFYKGAVTNTKSYDNNYNKNRNAIIKFNGEYYGTTDIKSANDDMIWIRLQRKNIIIKSDQDDIIMLLLIIVWAWTLMKIN
jgi:hypothetical protein